MRILFVIAFLASSILPSYSWGGHPFVAPIIPAISHHGSGAGASAGSAGAGAAAVGTFIGVVAVLIIVHEIKRKRCNMRHDTWVDTRHDMIPVRKPWHEPCKRGSDPRVTPAKLWPMGK